MPVETLPTTRVDRTVRLRLWLLIRNDNTLSWILVPDRMKLLETEMRKLFYLLLLRTGAHSNVCCLLSVCAVPDGVEVHIVCLVVLLKRLLLVNRILPLRRA